MTFLRDLEKYEWEKDFDDLQLADIIANEMHELAIPNNYEEYKKKLLAKRPINSLLRKENYKLGFPKFVKGTKTLADRPAVAEEPITKPSEPKKPISKVSETHPLAFEYSCYPYSNTPNPFHSRKITLIVNVAALNLPKAVRKRLIEICKIRDYYDVQRNQLKIKTQSKKTLGANKKKVVEIFRELMNEAWKADLNYLVPKDKAPPHIIIEKELTDKKKLEEEESLNSWENITSQNSWTLFRVTSFPAYDELRSFENQCKEKISYYIDHLNKL